MRAKGFTANDPFSFTTAVTPVFPFSPTLSHLHRAALHKAAPHIQNCSLFSHETNYCAKAFRVVNVDNVSCGSSKSRVFPHLSRSLFGLRCFILCPTLARHGLLVPVEAGVEH